MAGHWGRLILAASALASCSARPAAITKYTGEFGPETILLYAELRDATYGWLGSVPTPDDVVGVEFGNAINHREIWEALGEIVGPENFGQHKAIRATVRGRLISHYGGRIARIEAADDFEVVALPNELVRAWQQTAR